MNIFEKELESCLGKRQYKKVSSARIGIAGLGGLGSNCAFNLARSGFKHFVLADFDIVSISNLNRQFYFMHQIKQKKTEALKANLLGINPDLKIKLKASVLTAANIKEIFKGCDIIVEAFDKRECKAMLCEAFINSNKFVVSASGISGFGRSEEIKTKKINNNFYIVGDFKTEACAKHPPISPRVNIAAAKQANIVLEYVIGD